MKLTYAIIGTGGIGGYYGGKLANNHHDVHFLFHSDYNHVIQHGLRVDSVDGDFHISHPNAHANSAAMPKADVIFIGLKTTNNHLIKNIITPILKENTIIVLIQNGLGLEEKLNKELPKCQIAGGLAFICSEKVEPGHIKHMDYGKLIIGSYNVSNQEILKQVCIDLQKAGVNTEISEDLNSSRWQKLVWNIPFNGLTVVLNSSTKAIIENVDSKNLVYEMMLEVINTAKQCGAIITEQFADDMIDLTNNMKPYAPSMKVDYDNYRPLEIEVIYSSQIAFAKLKGCTMPKIEMLEKQLLFLTLFPQEYYKIIDVNI